MKSNYSYKCIQCGKTFTAEEIEKNFIYLCPSCGAAEKIQPLKGVLKILYDYLSIRQEISREQFLQLPPGQFWLHW